MAPHTDGSRALPRLGTALLVCLLSGLLVAGLALPLVGGLGLTAKASADEFLALPTDLSTSALATRSQVLAADGSVIATFYRVNRVTADPASIPATTKQAVVAIEDSRFYEHHGLDIKGTLRAAVTNARSGRVAQGGSTLTQQYVKNVLIEAALGDKELQEQAREGSIDRKLREARYAMALEEQLSKAEILNRYLDIAYYGNGVYGIATASDYYFGKPVAQMTLAESALLAGVVQNPTKFNVASTDETVRSEVLARRATVLQRMRDLGFVDDAQKAEAEATPLPTVGKKTLGSGGCEAPGVPAPFFCDYVRHELEDTPVGAALGDTLQERQARLFGGGLVIRTSLDPAVQAGAQAAVDARVPAGDPSGAATATDVVEPGTGKIKAMAVDRVYGGEAGQTKVNLADGGGSGFQAGSTFKIFTLTAALQKGLPLSLAIPSPPTYTSTAFPGKPYELSNAEASEGGTFDMRSATADSVNTYFVQLAERTGLEAPTALAEALGVRRKVAREPDALFLRDRPSIVLGAQEVSPLAMAGAYAAFAAHGTFCPPRAVQSVDSPSGPVALPESGCRQVVEPAIADTVTSVLTGVVTGGTGTRAQLGRPVAGKTGTTNESRAAWFVGYTPQLATAVWVGLPDPVSGAPRPMKNVRINGQSYRQMYGGDLPTQVWHDVMTGALKGVPAAPFTQADPTVAQGVRSEVPDVDGLAYDAAVARLREAGFSPTRGRQTASRQKAGTVVRTSPAGGSRAASGATVYVYPSTGRAAPPSPRPTAPRTTAPVPVPVTPPEAVVPPPAEPGTIATTP